MLAPLPERMRPGNLSEYVGQRHLVGKGCILRNMIDSGNLSSFILWGPPGVGKTTLARIISNTLDREFYTLSAVSSGVKDVREVIDAAKKNIFSSGGAPILFIDEIHRFNKAQQDSLLGAVEQGDITLIGATTENPSFEVISPLLSRCQVYVLKPLDESDLKQLTDKALHNDSELRRRNITISEDEALYRYAGGDARKLLNILELIANAQPEGDIVIDNATVTERLQQNPMAYDKNGEMHYDIISAFIKSVRGSDPDAAIYWLARMIAGGEAPEVRKWMLCGVSGGISPWFHFVGGQVYDRRRMELTPDLFRWVKKNETWLNERKNAAEIGVLWNQETITYYGRDHGKEACEYPWLGMTRALSESGLPFWPVHAD